MDILKGFVTSAATALRGLGLAAALLAGVALSGTVLGGETTQTVRQTEWTVMPEAIASFGAAVHDGWLYQYGGHIGRAHQHSTANLTDAFFRLNLIDRTSWERLPSQDPVQSCALVSVDGAIYRVGGMRALNGPGEKERLESTTVFSKYEPETRTWTSLPPLPEGRSSHDAVRWGSKIVVAGGWNLQLDSREWHSDVLAFDTANPEAGWTVVASQPFERRAIDATVTGDRLFVFGGITSKRDLSHDVDILDLHGGTWTAGPALEDNGFGCSATTLGSRLHVATMNGDLLRLSDSEDYWVPCATLAIPRFFHRLEAVGDSELAAIGGAARGGHCRTIEWIDPTSANEEIELLTAAIPYPGNACNRQGLFVDGNSFLVFGGNNSLGQHDFEPENFLDEAYQISLTDLSVRPRPSFPHTQQSFVEARVGKSHVAFGGFGPADGGATARAGIYTYSPKKREWSESVALPEPRTQFGVAEWDDATWIFGGLDYDPQRETAFEYPQSVLRARLQGDEPTVEATEFDLPRPRRAFGSAQIGSKVFLVGGMRENFQLVDECDVFDFETQSWSTMPAPRRSRISPELVAFDGDLYLIGGSSRSNPDEKFSADRSIEVFRASTGRWEMLIEELPFPVRHLRAVALETRILLYSAHSKSEPKRVQVGLLQPRKRSEPRPTSRPSSAL